MRLARGLGRRDFGPASLHLLAMKQIIEIQEVFLRLIGSREMATAA